MNQNVIRIPTLSDKAASLLRRSLGFLLDAVLVDLVILPLAIALGRWIAVVLAVTISTAYFVPLTAILGRTVGSSVVKVRLVRSTGDVPGWTRAIVRWGLLAALLVGAEQVAQSAIWGVLLVLYGPALFDSQRRSLLDRVSGISVMDYGRSPGR